MKTAIFIPARVQSSRLPKKLLLIIKGKTVIEHLIDRTKATKVPDIVVLCTTKRKEDDILVDIAKKNSIKYFRGLERDILSRHLGAATKYNIEFIVNVDSDDIFCDPEYMDKTINAFLKDRPDVIKWEGLPFGTAPLGIKVNALKKVCELKTENDTETGWGRYLTEGKMFDVKIIQANDDVRYPNIRISLDYPEDYAFFKKIFDGLYKPGKVITLKEIIIFIKNNPKIMDINKNVQEKYWKRFEKLSVDIKFREST